MWVFREEMLKLKKVKNFKKINKNNAKFFIILFYFYVDKMS